MQSWLQRATERDVNYLVRAPLHIPVKKNRLKLPIFHRAITIFFRQPEHTNLYSLFLSGPWCVSQPHENRHSFRYRACTLRVAPCVVGPLLVMPSSLFWRTARTHLFSLGRRSIRPLLMSSKNDIREDRGCVYLHLSCHHRRVECRPVCAAAHHHPTTVGINYAIFAFVSGI